ncbi:microtubule cross-linking factor 1-like isoform X2 [Scleropages formosus]|uniref:microtubule cross-linking factor 1-like isoform X2 n=1 Tax=Scleropages formosus TaxID=113540 RepID=UPI0010FABCF8|nr:microtubule cross-linking factor 1-like isoform X2 [Scleropages formosus]
MDGWAECRAAVKQRSRSLDAPPRLWSEPSSGPVTRRPGEEDGQVVTRRRAGVCLAIGSRSDSSSDLSDCPSDGSASWAPGTPTDTCTLALGQCDRGGSLEGRRSPGHSGGPAGSAPDGDAAVREDLLREIEELRSENDFLKDEVEELRAEMLEVKDSFVKQEAHELQELRRQLSFANKSCRVLQYRLRKAERRDPQGLGWLEQELQIAKDTSVRLHKELERAEERCCRAEDENEALRHRVLEEEVARAALQEALCRAQQSDVKREGSVEIDKEQKCVDQEDSAELRARLLSTREESVVLLRRVALLARQKDELEQELRRYRCVFGDADGAVPPGVTAAGAPLSTREAELRLRLQLVEEEADMLARKVVELEAENRAARVENEDLCRRHERGFPRTVSSGAPYGDGLERTAESRHHLYFAEEEAALPGDREGGSVTAAPPWEDGTPGSGGSWCCADLGGAPREQLSEDRVLGSSVGRCSLSSHPGEMEHSGQEEAGEDVLRGQREGPVGGESDFKGTPSWGASAVDGDDDAETLSSLKQEVRCLETVADLLIAHSDRLLRNGQRGATAGRGPGGDVPTDRLSADGESESRGLNTVNARLRDLGSELLSFVKKLQDLGTIVPPNCVGTVHHPSGAALPDGPSLPVLERDDTSHFHCGLRAEPHGPQAEERPLADSSRGDGSGEWSSASGPSAEGALSTQKKDGDSSRSSPSGRSGSGTRAPATGDRPSGWRRGTGRHPRTSENLFLEALCLDPLGRDRMSSPARPAGRNGPPRGVEGSGDTESRRSQSGLQREKTRAGNLLRVKTVCSLSDFQRLMDSSPFLADAGVTVGRDGGETPPLSPDDLDYLDEFETRGGDLAGARGSESRGAPETVSNPAEPSQPASGCCAAGSNHGNSIMQECGRHPVWKSSADGVPERPEVHEGLGTRPRKRSCKDQACQTDAYRKTLSPRTVRLGLQMEPSRRTAANPKQCLTPRGGATPVSSPCRNTQGRLCIPAAQNHLEPNCGAHLQCREPTNGRATTVLPSRGTGGSAWARSTTTRDSPVHAPPRDGPSSLFSVVDCPATTRHTATGSRRTRTAGRSAAERPPSAQHLSERREKESREVTGVKPNQKRSEDSSGVLEKHGREKSRTGGRNRMPRGQQGTSEPRVVAGLAPWRP